MDKDKIIQGWIGSMDKDKIIQGWIGSMDKESYVKIHFIYFWFALRDCIFYNPASFL